MAAAMAAATDRALPAVAAVALSSSGGSEPNELDGSTVSGGAPDFSNWTGNRDQDWQSKQILRLWFPELNYSRSPAERDFISADFVNCRA